MTNGTFWEFCVAKWRLELDYNHPDTRIWVVGSENKSLILMIWRDYYLLFSSY